MSFSPGIGWVASVALDSGHSREGSVASVSMSLISLQLHFAKPLAACSNKLISREATKPAPKMQHEGQAARLKTVKGNPLCMRTLEHLCFVADLGPGPR